MSFVYVVQPEDTLSKILRNAGGSWQSEDWRERALSLNPHIEDPNRIDINHLILIPESPTEMVLQEHIDYVSTVKNATRDALLKKEIERFAKKQEEAERKRKFLAKIDAINELKDSGVVYQDRFGSTVVIRAPVEPKKKTLIIHEAPAINYADPVDEKLATDITNSVLSCSATVIGVIGIFSGSALMPFSGGASSTIIYLSYIGASASFFQCVNGVSRTYFRLTERATDIDWYDSQEWYIYTSLIVDGLSLAGIAGATATTIKTILTLKRASGGKSALEILKGLNRQERKRLSQEIARIQHPGISNKMMKAMIKTGAIPKRYSQVQITHELKTQVLSVFGSGASLLGSGIDGVINKTGSQVIVLLVQEVVTE